jgi:predicted O-methyltransferase YrrM
VVVYTVIAGPYDEPPTFEFHDPRVECYCFSDYLTSAPEPWTLVPIESYFKDPKLTSGYLKTNPNLLFPPTTIAVWVDANLDQLRIDSDAMRALVKNTPFAMPAHRERADVASEAKVVVELGLDDTARVSRLLRELSEHGYPDDRGLGATMMVVRDLSKPSVHRVDRAWWDGIALLSRRDQLTVNYALWSADVEWHEIAVDYRKPNPLFSRKPHAKPEGRRLTTNPTLGVVAPHSAWMSFGNTELPADYPLPPIWPRERWDHGTTELLREINDVVAASPEEMEGNYCHFHRANIARLTPPDIRRSWKREFLRRASSTSRRALEIGFNAGHSAATLLGANPSLHLTSVDIGEHDYSRSCAELVATAYPNRFDAVWGDSAIVLPTLERSVVDSIDFVHIGGGHGEGAFAADLGWFLDQGPKSGSLLLVDDVYVARIREPLTHACSDGKLEEVQPGLPSSGENRLYRKM